MTPETYQLKLENLTLKLRQHPTQAHILQYLEARIALLEEFLQLSSDPKAQQK